MYSNTYIARYQIQLLNPDIRNNGLQLIVGNNVWFNDASSGSLPANTNNFIENQVCIGNLANDAMIPGANNLSPQEWINPITNLLELWLVANRIIYQGEDLCLGYGRIYWYTMTPILWSNGRGILTVTQYENILKGRIMYYGDVVALDIFLRRIIRYRNSLYLRFRRRY